jgi:hypothetical protein
MVTDMTTTVREVHWPAFQRCPSCSVKAGEACLDGRDWQRGERRRATPHPSRKLRPAGYHRPYTCDGNCDTNADYQDHRTYGEQTCPGSRRAHTVLVTSTRPAARPREVPPHGTRNRYERENKAYQAYLHRGGPEAPEPCDECLAAKRAYEADRKARAQRRAS